MARVHTKLGSAALLASSTLIVLVTAGCTGTATVTGSSSGAPLRSYPPLTSGAEATDTAGATTTAAQPILKFPNTNFPALVEGYDNATQMVTFEVSKWVPGGDDDGHYSDDPAKPGQHRLPLAAQVTVTSFNTMCAGVAPSGDPSKSMSCTRDQFIQGLKTGSKAIAQVSVDATDHITTVKEIFTP
jgi:hypothetical protein